MIMQSYDFLRTCSSITAATCSSAATTSGATCIGGTELIRRKLGKDAYGMTIHAADRLSEGKKMGKTAGGAVWLDPEQDQSLTSSTSTGAMWMTPTL